MDDDKLNLLANYYIPYNFGWDRILNTKGAFTASADNKNILQRKEAIRQFVGKNKTLRSANLVTQSNILSDKHFAMANPDYIASLKPEKVERKPSYKTMLENGNPILDVIKSIKPFNLQGTNIVFMGSANSLNFQGGALIVIDGINRGTDASVLRNLSPYDVEKIFVSTNPNDILRYTGLNSVGLIEIDLKKGMVKEEPTSVMDESTEFESPNYEKGANSFSEDYRSTLFWKVETVEEGLESIDIQYYNADLISEIEGVLYFIPNKGGVSSSAFEYSVK
jgi:hypothetical protein